MVRLASSLVALLALASHALALDVAINNPISSTVWESGKTVKVGWLVSESGPLPDQVQVNLMKADGDVNAATLVGNLGTANVRDGGIAVIVPDGVASGGDYFVQVGTAATAYKYSSQFKVDGSSAKPSSASSSAAASSTASASASSSASATKTASSTTTKTSSPTASPNAQQNGAGKIVAPLGAALAFVAALLV